MKKLICAVTVLAVSAARADTIFVDDNAPLGGDGLGWGSAYTFLQDALGAAAASGGAVTEIRVAQGTYTPDRDEAGAVIQGDREATFQLVDGVTLAGGFAGLGAADPDDRDVELYETILSGDLAGDDGPDFANNEENSYHVVSFVQTQAVVDGITITRGNADVGGGGGVHLETGSNLIMGNCRVVGNFAASSSSGGGLFLSFGADVTLTDCTISGNVGPVGPGNSAGGVSVQYSGALYMDRCRVIDNTGDGVALFLFAFAQVTNSVFTGNQAGVRSVEIGAAAYISNCIFMGNLSTGASAGIGSIRNCVISGNGGIGATAVGSGKIINCTIYGNAGFGVLLFASEANQVWNCIIWNNGLGSVYDPYSTVRYSNVQGGWPGTGNIDADPLFVDPDGADNVLGTEDDDLRLLPGSPGIDAGRNFFVPVGITTDLDGNPRFLEIPETPDCQQAPGTCGELPVVDMGAYESLGGGCLAVTSQEVVCHGDGTTFTVNVEGLNACTGGTTQVTFTASGGAVGQELCFTALVNDGGFCCSTEICVIVPNCADCNNNGILDGMDIVNGTSLDCTGNGVPDECDVADGTSPDVNGNGLPDECECLADINGTGSVDISDFLTLLASWGPCEPGCFGDVDFDGNVGILDFLTLLANWGPCP